MHACIRTHTWHVQRNRLPAHFILRDDFVFDRHTVKKCPDVIPHRETSKAKGWLMKTMEK